MENEALAAMNRANGWFSEDEGRLLYRTAASALSEIHGHAVEIGSYKGRSTVVLGWAARGARPGTRVFAIDPHKGVLTGRTVKPTWEDFKATISASGVEEFIVPIRQKSADVSWNSVIAMLFIDGVHDMENVSCDYGRFSNWVPPGGYVAFHDYSNPDHPDVRMFVDGLVRDGALSVEAMPPMPGKQHSLIVTRKNVTLSIIIPTCGRETLALTLSSIVAAGATRADEVIVVGDGPQSGAKKIVSGFTKHLTVSYCETKPTRMVGAHQRNVAVAKATRSHLMFIDDDDTYMPGALAAARCEAQRRPGRIILFREVSTSPRHPWGIVWKEKRIAMGNVGSQMMVVPNVKGRLGTWPSHIGSDYGFLRSTVDLLPSKDDEVVWVDRVIARLH